MATHIYRYNVHSEQRYFLGKENRGKYDLIALNGNLVSNTPTGIAALVSTVNKAFYIDPQTHAFQHDTKNLKRDISNKEMREPPKLEFKPSIRKLANNLGGPFYKVIEADKPLSPNDFYLANGTISNDIINQVCNGVVSFQLNTLKESLKDDDKEFMEGGENFNPEFIISPYFYLVPDLFEEWFDITIKCFVRTREIFSNLNIYYNLVLSKELLKESKVDKIVQELSLLKPEGILLWIDSHFEENLIDFEIERFIYLLKNLKNISGTVFNMYGGYLSILLTHKNINYLDGVGHSINYGQYRPIIPVGGGYPLAYFYFPSIHSRLRFVDALGIIYSKKWLKSVQDYLDNVCKCSQCQKLIKENKSLDDAFMAYGETYPKEFNRRSGTIVRLSLPTAEAKRVAAQHYLYCKAKEFQNVKRKELDELLNKMNETFKTVRPNSSFKLISHLFNWQSMLKRFK